MTNMIRSVTLLVFFGVVLSVLGGCGTEMCVMGIGSCDEDLTSPVGGSLRLEATDSRVFLGEKLTLTVKGGKPPYRFTIVGGDGSVSPSTTSGNKTVFTAPTKLTTPPATMIRVRDSRDKTKSISIVCEEKP